MTFSNPEAFLVKHEEPYHGKIVNLHVDTIRHPSGRTAIREVVIHPGGVVAVPLLDDGKLLMIRQFRYPLKTYILEFPAGKLDSGSSAREIIARELEEETGYRAGSLTHECSFYTSPGISNELLHLFIARNLSPVPQRLGEGEHLSVETYSAEQCIDMMVKGEIRDGKTLLGLLWYARKIRMK
jgi:ADP-ribose pyrophosphatase